MRLTAHPSGRVRLALSALLVLATAVATAAGATAAASAAIGRSQQGFGAAIRTITTAAAANLTMLPAGRTGSRSQIPWRIVGQGWALAEFTTGSPRTARPVELYLVDPAGGRYLAYRWPATRSPWQLIDWSGDKARALFEKQGGSRPALHQLVLATGKVTTFRLPSASDFLLGYTRPHGASLLISGGGISRVSLTGAPQKRLITGAGFAAALSAANGATEVVNGPAGVDLVSNAGGIVRRLPVPGASPKLGGCTPVRWWTATTALVSCIANTQIASPRLWLVPVSGAAPRALTPVRNGRDGDYGDTDAWRFGPVTYVQALGACGVRYISRESAGRKVTPVSVPGGTGNNAVVAVSGHRMLVQEYSECASSSSVAWFSPATGAATAVLRAPEGSAGVLSVVAFNATGQQPGGLP